MTAKSIINEIKTYRFTHRKKMSTTHSMTPNEFAKTVRLLTTEFTNYTAQVKVGEVLVTIPF